MDLVIVFGVVGVFGGWLAIMVVWGLTGRIKGRTAGVHPFFKQTPLEDGEVIVAELGAIGRVALGAYRGMLVFTDRRLIFLPRRNVDSPTTLSIGYATIADWRIEKRRQIGLGANVPFRTSALVVNTTDGTEHVYWAAPGYDIVKKATQALPSALAGNGGSELRT